jgi:hypothetical protein
MNTFLHLTKSKIRPSDALFLGMILISVVGLTYEWFRR